MNSDEAEIDLEGHPKKSFFYGFIKTEWFIKPKNKPCGHFIK